MDEFVNKTLFWIITVLLTGLTSIIGILFGHLYDKNKKEMLAMRLDIDKNKDTVDNKLSGMIKEFQDGVKALNSAVFEMKEFISVVKVQHGEQIFELKRRVENKTKWLEEHDQKLDKHSERLTSVEAACRYHHK